MLIFLIFLVIKTNSRLFSKRRPPLLPSCLDKTKNEHYLFCTHSLRKGLQKKVCSSIWNYKKKCRECKENSNTNWAYLRLCPTLHTAFDFLPHSPSPGFLVWILSCFFNLPIFSSWLFFIILTMGVAWW